MISQPADAARQTIGGNENHDSDVDDSIVGMSRVAKDFLNEEKHDE